MRAAKKIATRSPSQIAEIETALRLLSADAFDPRLKTHKLKGELEGSWACSAGYDLRIVFTFVPYEAQDAVLLETIGTHEEVY
jgi:mRNA-degrading endonuclease YafQ of YafQ-DinJ toxin-antitoxin module